MASNWKWGQLRAVYFGSGVGGNWAVSGAREDLRRR